MFAYFELVHRRLLHRYYLWASVNKIMRLCVSQLFSIITIDIHWLLRSNSNRMIESSCHVHINIVYGFVRPCLNNLNHPIKQTTHLLMCYFYRNNDAHKCIQEQFLLLLNIVFTETWQQAHLKQHVASLSRQHAIINGAVTSSRGYDFPGIWIYKCRSVPLHSASFCK